ncbi:MAG: DUF5996 family protein, partial [Myxococcaceae bacterium]
MAAQDDAWPAFDYPASRETLEALHLQTQVVGKVKLALTAVAPEWQNIPLWVNASGLTTGLLRAGGVGLELAFDLVHHRFVASTTDGRSEGFELKARPLRAFTAEVMAALGRLQVSVTVNPLTVEVPNPVRFDEYDGCNVYDAGLVTRLFRILAHSALVLEDFRAGFWGKQGPVSFFWGTFDLAVARFNLAPVAASPGMGRIYRVAMDSQQFEVGFWFGNEKYPHPAYYAFTYPKPPRLEAAAVRPSA